RATEAVLDAFYVHAFMVGDVEAELSAYFKGNRLWIPLNEAPSEIKEAAELLWSGSRPQIIDQLARAVTFRRAVDYLSRPRFAPAKATPPRTIEWARQAIVPTGQTNGPTGTIDLGQIVGGAAAVRALDSEATKLAATWYREGRQAKRDWEKE